MRVETLDMVIGGTGFGEGWGGVILMFIYLLQVGVRMEIGDRCAMMVFWSCMEVEHGGRLLEREGFPDLERDGEQRG